MGCTSTKPKMPHDVPQEIITDELNRLYDHFDKDGDGKITKAEIFAVLKHTNIYVTEEEAAEIVNRFDTDGDGCLGRAEFQKMLAGYIKKRKQNLIRLFEHFDVNGDGYLSYSEFKRAMFFLGESLTLSDIRDMMETHYRNPSNKVNFKQFCLMVHSFV